MPLPVSDAQVRAVRPSAVITDYTAYILAADSIVSSLNSACGTSFTDAQLEQIEIWLTAHVASAYDASIIEEKFEGASKKFQRSDSMGAGVLSTNYGQMANMLANGCLADMDKTTAEVTFL